MRILPIGIASQLLLSQRAMLYSPRILRYGIAQSLLVARFRYRNGPLFLSVLPTRPDRPAVAIPATQLPAMQLPEIETIKSLDLLWPSEVAEDELIIVIEERHPEPRPEPGSVLDILT